MIILAVYLFLLVLLIVGDSFLANLKHLRVVFRVQVLRLKLLLRAEELAECVTLED